MLTLAHDKVANVRLALARALSELSRTVLTNLPEVLRALNVLARDEDPDVVNCVMKPQSDAEQHVVMSKTQ